MRRRNYSSELFDFCQTHLSLTDTSEERCSRAVGVPHVVTVVVPTHDPEIPVSQASQGFGGDFLVPDRIHTSMPVRRFWNGVEFYAPTDAPKRS